jgi:hypothetical protein
MAFVMTTLKRLKSGALSARKVIPKDVRDEYRARFGGGWEERYYAKASASLGEAKSTFNDWLAEIELRIDAIRAETAGHGQSLTRRQALALAGEWYLWFVKLYEDDPGDPEGWEVLQDEMREEVLQCAPAWFQKDESRDPTWRWAQDLDVRQHLRPFVGDKAQTAQFLASKGLALTNEARDLFLDAVGDEFVPAIQLLIRRANDDYTHDRRPERFPKFVQASPASQLDGPTCSELFEGWIKASEPRPSTINRWRAVFLDLQSHFSDRSAQSITQDDARAWKDRLITKDRSAKTVSEIWLVAARTVFGWAAKERLVTANPFVGVTVKVPRKRRLRETDAFTAAEAQTILKAAKSPSCGGWI